MNRGRNVLTGSVLSSRVAQWTQPGFVKSIQRGTIAIAPAASSNTATITAVDLANARLRFLGFSITAASTNDKMCLKIVFTNATTITATVNTATDITVTASFEVTEYWPGVIKSVQRGTVAGNATATITTVNTAKTEVDCLGSSGSDANTNITSVARLTLTNSTTVTPTSVGGAADTVSYQVVEWF